MSFIDYKKRRIIQHYFSYITIARIMFCSFLFGAFTTFIYLNEIGARNLLSLSTSKETYLSLTGVAIFFTTLFMIYGISSIAFKIGKTKKSNNFISKKIQIGIFLLLTFISSIAFYYLYEHFIYIILCLMAVIILTITTILKSKEKQEKYELIDYVDIYFGYGFYVLAAITTSLFISLFAYIFFDESIAAYWISIIIVALLHTSYSFYFMGKIKRIKDVINLHIIMFFIIMIFMSANGKVLLTILGTHNNNEKPYIITDNEEYILDYPKNVINIAVNKLNKNNRTHCGKILYEDSKYKVFLPHHETDVKNNIIIPDQNIKLYQGLFKELICEQSITLWNVGYLIK
ncbi:hypothetical protein [Actinobacillus equuli]|uniref:hypothetical protein n=1 Tax=Actinobacillus equuli TaxID=718 RepID=UPI0024188156|nr:hypothetical protein [Actinobacillus equuli]MDG4953357.1 hypothetical protein [Actinobacillus equuli subsp. equuli]